MREITVVNHHHLQGRTEGTIYIGRPGRGEAGSPLANPYRIGDPRPGGGHWERGESIAAYERDLREALDPEAPAARWGGRVLGAVQREAIRAEVRRLGELAAREALRLRCFCVRPDGSGACHGHVIRRILEELHAHAAASGPREP